MFSGFPGCGFVYRLVLLATLVCLFFFGRQAPSQAPAPSPTDGLIPRLAVLVVFDQMRGDYLERWQCLFGEDGFRRLQTEGVWFQNCHFPYAFTFTGPGHASLATGCSPQRHGIVGNEWYNRSSGDDTYCVASERFWPLPPEQGENRQENQARKKPATHGSSPERLLVPTLADALKEATSGKARVVALSLKDRSAVFLGGRRPDACYWFASWRGTFMTSTYYGDRLRPWLAEFNRDRPADRWFGQTWDRLRPDLDYVRYTGPNNVAGKGSGFDQGRAFPHAMTGGLKKPGKSYYEALENSPFGNDLLLSLAKRAIEAEHLGRHDVPDLLCLSFSSNDPVGHCWGPDSPEVLDITLRSDQIVKSLLDHLDTHVGRGRYVLAVTADHGVCPLPEVSRAQGKDAQRISENELESRAGEFLQETLDPKGEKAQWIEARTSDWLYLNQNLLRERKLEAARVQEALAGWLKKQPGILTAYTRTQLMGNLPADDDLGQRVRRSFHPRRCGDVAVVVKPYYLITSQLTWTLHGSPHPYDTHVPLLVYGPGIRGGARPEPVTPQAVASILARSLGIKPPPAAEAPVPKCLKLKQASGTTKE
jgi:hypothetical protein